MTLGITYDFVETDIVRVVQVGDVRYVLSSQSPDLISAHLRQGKVWEQTTLALARLALTGLVKTTVLDVGANLGAFSVPIGYWLKAKGGRVWAFEPQRMVFYQLCGNLFANGLSNVVAHHAAVGDGSVQRIDVPQLDPFKDPNLGALSLDASIQKWQRGKLMGSGVEQVPYLRLDDLALDRVDLIKIDVEGMELEVLQGAKGLLARSAWPPVLFEVWTESLKEYAAKRAQLLAFVKDDLGYEVQLIGDLCIAQHPTNRPIEFQTKGYEVQAKALRAPVV